MPAAATTTRACAPWPSRGPSEWSLTTIDAVSSPPDPCGHPSEWACLGLGGEVGRRPVAVDRLGGREPGEAQSSREWRSIRMAAYMPQAGPITSAPGSAWCTGVRDVGAGTTRHRDPPTQRRAGGPRPRHAGAPGGRPGGRAGADRARPPRRRRAGAHPGSPQPHVAGARQCVDRRKRGRARRERRVPRQHRRDRRGAPAGPHGGFRPASRPPRRRRAQPRPAGAVPSGRSTIGTRHLVPGYARGRAALGGGRDDVLPGCPGGDHERRPARRCPAAARARGAATADRRPRPGRLRRRRRIRPDTLHGGHVCRDRRHGRACRARRRGGRGPGGDRRRNPRDRALPVGRPVIVR